MKHIIRVFAVLCFVAVSGCAHNDPMTKGDTAMYVLASAAMVADGLSTADIQNKPGCYEDGPAKAFLGTQPSSSDTAMYFGTLIVSNYFITRAMPHKYRKYWNGTLTVAHGYASNSNCN